MALLLSEADVKSILTMPLAIEAVENSFQRLADGALCRIRASGCTCRGKVISNTWREGIVRADIWD